ncbi:MAG: GreA/GreB family elongation factor, partial [Sphingomonas sp.]
EGSGATRTITLVYPGEADIAAGKVSVFTPIGAGLIGMRAGRTILWPDRDGASHRLRVVKVDRP